eukprot:gene5149-5389_t
MKPLYTCGIEDTAQLQQLIADCPWLHEQYHHILLPAEAAQLDDIDGIRDSTVAAAAIILPGNQQQLTLKTLRRLNRSMFIICWHPNATEDARMRWQCFLAGANMVTYCRMALQAALKQVAAQQEKQHIPLPPPTAASSCCPGRDDSSRYSCDWPSSNLAVHLHNEHHPEARWTPPRTGVFAICVVRRPSDGKFLMPQEFAGAGYWLPGGGVDPGETLSAAAHRCGAGQPSPGHCFCVECFE